MADTRTFAERQNDLVGVEQGARLVGIEEIESQRRRESELRQVVREQGEFIQKLKRDIRDFLDHPSLGTR